MAFEIEVSVLTDAVTKESGSVAEPIKTELQRYIHRRLVKADLSCGPVSWFHYRLQLVQV